MSSTNQRHYGAGLVAVLLITRSRPGPRLVFHFPSVPNWPRSEGVPAKESVDSDSESDDEENSLAQFDVENGVTGPNLPELNKLQLSDETQSTSDLLLGHSIESLEKLLSPGRWCDGRKFEVCLNGLTFVGHPIYASEDGEWAEKRPENGNGSRNEYTNGSHAGDVTPMAPDLTETLHDFIHVPESFESQPGVRPGTSVGSNSTTSGVQVEHLAMFHVVFALGASSGGEQHRESSAVYQDVARTLSRALQYCQKQSNYVAAESQKLLSYKSRAKLLQANLRSSLADATESSELAWALKEVYQQISSGGIASIRLCGIEMSINIDNDDRREFQSSVALKPLSTLLLLENKDSILRELSHPEASPLARFIREHTPTKSLQKHANRLAMPIEDILYLARHLVKWRKARIIPPLHQRNTYVVNPDAALDQLTSLSESYTRAFPTLPSLPNVLKVLSGKPIQYGLLIPSRDHRGPYMEILAFLVRHELVAQLKTYGWLRIPQKLAHEPLVESNNTVSRKSAANGFNILSPHLRPVQDDDNISVTSDRTTIAPLRAMKSPQKLKSGTGVQASSTAVAAVNDSNSNNADEQREKFVIVTNPTDPSDEDFRLMRHVLGDPELRENLTSILPHLDGEHAFEEIAAREGVKRAQVEECLADLEKKGFLTTVRYQ